jgi:uncharacterized protein YdeI (BOF family)
MKHLILAAAFALIAAPAFAGDVHDTIAPKAKTFTDTQVGSYTRSYDAGSNRAQRDANLRRAAQERSENARAASRGLPHYY